MNLVLGRKGLMKTPWTSQERVNWEETTENSKEVCVCGVVLGRRFCLPAMARSSIPKEIPFTIKEQRWGHTELRAGLVLSPGNRAGT